MPTFVGFQEPISGCEPLMKPLDETVWQAWLAKNRAEELRRSATRVKTVKWASVLTLVAAAFFGSYLGSYGAPVRFVLTLGAIVVMLDALKLRDYTFATVFGTLALLYNPVLPVVNFSGFWQFALMILSALLFIVSLTWRRVKSAHYDYRCDVGTCPPPKRARVSPINVGSEKAPVLPLPAAEE
jgi:hypothetical protein